MDRNHFPPYGYLVPFAVLCLYGFIAIGSWMSGNLSLVQPHADLPMPVSAGVCILLVGFQPIALALGSKRTALFLALVVVPVAGAGFFLGQMPVVMAVVFLLIGPGLVWSAWKNRPRGPELLMGLGSICAAYGLAGLLAPASGLDAVEVWQTSARLGPVSAVALVLLGIALVALAARGDSGKSARCLWVPALVGSITGTLLFWVALQQRELVYLSRNPELTRSHLPELALCAGLGMSCLLGLLVNLALPVCRPAGAQAAASKRPAEKEERRGITAGELPSAANSRGEAVPPLRGAEAEVDEVSRVKTEFLASMSHEIRTPMNGVIGMTSLLLGTELTAEQRDYVSTIRTSGDTLLSIINEILDFSKIESGRIELEYQPFDLALCVEEAIDLFVGPAAAKNIEVAYFIEAKTPGCVLGDSSRVRQVLVNLLKNAVTFTDSGSITLEVRTGGEIASSPGENALLEFRVKDTGIGIPPERLGLLFKPFSQVDSSNTRKYGGTGLGLAIADRLCQLMGGNIDVTSTPGEGSCFRFSIQAKVVHLASVAKPNLAAIPAGGPILAVDDLPLNRARLNECLNTWQLLPLIAADATEALSLVASGPLAAAIIDHDLAGAPSLRLVAELRASRPHLPIIILTSAGEPHRRGDSHDALFFHLPKPIKPLALYDALRHAIVGASSIGSSPAMIGGLPIRLAESIPLDILLVEDNPVNQKIALRFLQRLGYRADAVANGLEAVQTVRARDYKLLFMDVQMPEMDGFAATREIRATIAKDRQPVIIALTANAMQGDRERCLDAGMNDYITKPVKIDEIEQIIRRFFALKSSER